MADSDPTREPVDRTSPVPYYQQMAAVLERRMTDGALAPGDRLPSEHDLGEEFGLSRATVRQGLSLLESRGRVVRVAHRGVFVAESRSDRGWMVQGPEGFLEQALGHDRASVTTRVLRHRSVVLPPAVCRALGVPARTRGHELVRLRSVDGTPALYSVNHSPPRAATAVATSRDVLTGRASLTATLDSAGFSTGGAERTVVALPAPVAVARHLDVAPGTPLLQIRSVSWTDDGERYDVYETWVRTDVVPLTVTVRAVDVR